MKGLSLSTEGTYIFYKTYNLKGAAEDHINTDYQVRGGLSYSINEHISVSSRISTKDRTITQKQFFDQQTTNFSIGTSFNL
jgi:hypothetical protein